MARQGNRSSGNPVPISAEVSRKWAGSVVNGKKRGEATQLNIWDVRVEAELSKLPGWKTFSTKEKSFLMLRPLYSTHKETCRVLGVTPAWWEKSTSRNKMLHKALWRRLDKASDLLAFPEHAIWLKAIYQLSAVLDHEDVDVRLKGVRAAASVIKAGMSLWREADRISEPQPKVMQSQEVTKSW